MRNYEIEGVGHIEIEAAFRRGIYNITAVVVEEPYQGLGLGTVLVKLVQQDAQREGVELWLVPIAFSGEYGRRLLQFYDRLGFERTEPRGSGYWIWRPELKEEN